MSSFNILAMERPTSHAENFEEPFDGKLGT